MDEKNLINKPVIIFGLVILILIGMSYIPEGISILGIELKNIDILEDIREDEKPEPEKNSSSLKKSENLKFTKASIIRSIESLEYLAADEFSKIKRTSTPSPVFADQPIEGNIEQLNYFYSALQNSKEKQIRIAHYGDSSLEGDLITSYLRNKFQQKFGGKGVGFLPIISEDVSFRETAKIKFSDDWKVVSISGSNNEETQVGISGKVFLNSINSWVEYETIPKFRTIRNFNIAKIFYGNAGAGAIISYSIDQDGEKEFQLNSNDSINVISITKRHSKKLRIEIPGNRSAHFYGVSLEDISGVYIDNFPLRGNSGVDLRKISQQKFNEFQSLMNYKLVILEFGLNILNGRKTNFDKYENEMVKIIEELKRNFPETSYLLISVRDKAIKRKRDFVSDPSILSLVKTQERIAIRSNIAFWNLFKAMGGENSMVNWVNANPPLAYTDYTHFTSLGTEKEAEMLFEMLMKTKDSLK